MHDGCFGTFQSGKQIVDKIRMMGFNTSPLPSPVKLDCSHCNGQFTMAHMESSCPDCGMVYGVTPCHSHLPEFIQAAGVNY